MLADLTVNTYTNLKFMRFKEYSAAKYNDIEMQTIITTKSDVRDEDEEAVQPRFSIGDDP